MSQPDGGTSELNPLIFPFRPLSPRRFISTPDRLLVLAVWAVCTLCATALGEESAIPMTTKESVEHVAKLRVFFGHQSVGGNIIDALKSYLPVFDVTDSQTASRNVSFFHALVGQNTQPLTKLSAFEAALDSLEARQTIDVAMVKFCYVDFDSTTDVDGLVDAYTATLRKLQAKYPKTTFVHITAPLTIVQGGVRGWLKSRFGTGAWGENENVKREAFNQRIRSTFRGEPIFDLAALEATLPDGRLDTYRVGEASIPRLRADFTDDGGHLNGAGRAAIATALVRFLATVPIKSDIKGE